MTSVFGHVMSLDFVVSVLIKSYIFRRNIQKNLQGHYNAWDKVDPYELFSCPTEKKETNPKTRMVSFLANEAKFCNYLVLW